MFLGVEKGGQGGLSVNKNISTAAEEAGPPGNERSIIAGRIRGAARAIAGHSRDSFLFFLFSPSLVYLLPVNVENEMHGLSVVTFVQPISNTARNPFPSPLPPFFLFPPPPGEKGPPVKSLMGGKGRSGLGGRLLAGLVW